jgi:NAD(P)-dependent dehydrogenase (short-subunit alcohol dehydrogenase family)
VEDAALDAAATLLRHAGVDVLAVRTDVTDPVAVGDLARASEEHFGAYHVVCNNAGVAGHFGRSWETPLEDWRWVFDVNVWGVINGIRSFVPSLIAQGEGHLVNTASIAGWAAPAAMAPYAASKHAVLAISESLRAELVASGTGVGVSALCPGLVNTKIMSSERNWPVRLGGEPPVPRDEVTSQVHGLLTEGTTSGGLDPSLAAEVVLAGIRANRFILTTHPEDLVAAADARLAKARKAAP